MSHYIGNREVTRRHERLRYLLDAYLIGVARGDDYERRFPLREPVGRHGKRCECWLCAGEDIGFEVGQSARRASP